MQRTQANAHRERIFTSKAGKERGSETRNENAVKLVDFVGSQSEGSRVMCACVCVCVELLHKETCVRRTAGDRSSLPIIATPGIS